MKLSKLSPKTFFHNIYNLFAYDYHQADISHKKQLEQLRLYLAEQQMTTFFNEDNIQPYIHEIQFVKENGICHFPYEQKKRLHEVSTGYDKKFQLPYVIHNGKRLFFPHDYSIEKAEKQYREFIETENLLGGGYTNKAPHQYQTETFKVEKGDVFVDVGAAEGLVALDVVERASKLYIIESDSYWIPALKATFMPYKDKCTIIHKLVSDKNTFSSITLEHLLLQEKSKHIFIKMDIEGHETQVLKASKDYFSKASNIKIACCTYHKHHDAEYIASYFSQLNYKYEFSDGWMIHWLLDEGPIYPPFFRHGLIRAWKENA